MTIALVLIALGVAVCYAVRAWYRSALARQTAQDAAALAEYTMGTRYSSPAMAAPYDYAKAVQAHQRQTRRAAHARAKSRKAQNRVKPATVPVPFRKVAK